MIGRLWIGLALAAGCVGTVHGQPAPFTHRDQNTLTKVGDPQPNPLARIVAAKSKR